VRGGSRVAGGRVPSCARGEIEGSPATPAATSPLNRLPPDQARGARPAPMGHQFGGGREAGGGRRGLPIIDLPPRSLPLRPHPCLLSTWTELWGTLGALQMQIRVGGEGWGALARARCGLAGPLLSTRHRPCRPCSARTSCSEGLCMRHRVNDSKNQVVWGSH